MTQPIVPPSRRAPAGAAPLLGVALLLGAALPLPARSAEASAWVRGAQSQARLIAAGAAPDGGALLAGLEIRLEPRFITYWRDPGDAGVPPVFSFAGSVNLKAATVRYPAPSSLDEAGAKAFGYEGGVVFPILVEPGDPSRPVDLAVALDYAVCHDICLPAHADLRAVVDARPSLGAAQVRDALAAVPRPATVGTAGALPRIVAVAPVDADGGFAVEAAVPAGAGTLFVEAPEGWSYAPGTAVPNGPGSAVFPVKRVDGPPGALRPAAPLVLTLSTAGGAVEVPVTLDGARATP